MFKLTAIINGILIAVMISFNGLLAKQLGNNIALIVIHILGVFTTSIIFIFSRYKYNTIKGLPIYLFIGGAIGIFNISLNNMTINKLGVALTIGLCLLGQLGTSMIIDHYGLFGVNVSKINIKKLTGILIMSIGIVVMITI
ncbi:MAG: DMT family transporter [Vallitalea sp.]|jgi:transporter family-2 protein|nr:DMT family transporter [Vallitalea sp.]